VEKEKVFQQVKSRVEEKVAELHHAIEEAELSRDSDTKSSAGDKHETSRAMAQIEIEQLQVQLQRVLQSKDILDKMNTEDGMTQGQLGSLIDTDAGIYFLSIGLGPIQLEDGQAVYAVSLQAPIGELLLGKSKGDSITLNDKVIQIFDII
jgi:transcription elongation GreA/GreB family factor